MPRTGSAYGPRHEQTRAYLLANLIDGTPCDRCLDPMTKAQPLDAAHPHDKPASLHPNSHADHLEHRACNQAAGNGTKPRTPLRTSREW